MALRQIRVYGDDILTKKCREVKEMTPRLQELIDDMLETMYDADGVGLAAPQVGVLRRIAIVENDGQFIELINPEIIAREGVQNEIEGCLSVPDVWGITERPEKVTVRATDRNGKEFTATGEGLLARAFCHEIDHLSGKLFTDEAVRILSPEEVKEMLG